MKKLMIVVCLLFAGGAFAAGDPVAERRVLGYQLDVSRCKVPTMVWREASPMTPFTKIYKVYQWKWQNRIS